MEAAELDTVLEDLNVAALLMTIIHLTGDMSWVRGPIRRTFLNPLEQAAGGHDLVDGFNPGDAKRIRAAARDLLDRRAQPPRDLTADEIDEMIAFLTGESAGGAAASLLRELAFDGPTAARPVEGAAHFPVAIIGAGQGGIAVAIRLSQMGIPYVVLEKNEGIGGTWFENAYPGVRVDVPGHTYSYSFAPNPDWSSFFPEGAEIRAYYEGIAERFGVTANTRFGTEVLSARWDEDAATWEVATRGPDGEGKLIVRALVTAVGQLNRPRWPDIEGLNRFAGRLIHSAQWPKEAALEGLRVGLIGSGATAFQIVPRLQAIAGELVAFQRSPAWMFPNSIYHSRVSDAKKQALRDVPFYTNWHRFTLLHAGFEGVYDQTRVDPAWTKAGAVSEMNDKMREGMTWHIASQVNDPALLAKVLPTYPPFGKRILQDEGSYLRALQADNVTLEVGRIGRVTADAVEMADGTCYPVDVLVCATGFHADRMLAPMTIVGRNGVTLEEQWEGTNSRAHLGITVPNFPNLFCVYGPNTNWVVAGSIVINAEYQASYIGYCLQELIKRRGKAITVRQDAHDTYNDEIDRTNAASAWGTASVTNWYKNGQGRVVANMPLRPLHYWQRLQHPNFEEYEIT